MRKRLVQSFLVNLPDAHQQHDHEQSEEKHTIFNSELYLLFDIFSAIAGVFFHPPTTVYSFESSFWMIFTVLDWDPVAGSMSVRSRAVERMEWGLDCISM